MKNKELFTIRIFDLLNIIFNIIIVFFIARGRWINIQPSGGTVSDSISELLEEQLIQKNFNFFEYLYETEAIAVVVAFVTFVLSFIINKFIIKRDKEVLKHIVLFCLMSFINLVVYEVARPIAI